MRWEAFTEVLPHAAILHLARTHATVESFLVNGSKALASNTPYGSIQDTGDAAEGSSSVDPATLAAVEAVVCDALAPPWRSGLQLMHELQHSVQVLPTGCMAIDTLLGGGLREGVVVEVAGETASGKTQLCLSAAATTAFRGEAVLYVDTTGSFTAGRVVQMGEAAAAATASGSEAAPWPQALDPAFGTRLLTCISVLRPHDVFELLAMLDRLAAGGQPLPPQHQQQHQQQGQSDEAPRRAAPGGVSTGLLPDGRSGGGLCGRDVRSGPRLVVVDSVSGLLSPVLGSNQHTQGYTLLTVVGRMLKQIAVHQSAAVLLTNHVTSTTAMARGPGSRGGAAAGGGDGGDRSAPLSVAGGGVLGLKPALGEHWRPQPHMRLHLSVDNSQPPAAGARIGILTASPLLVSCPVVRKRRSTSLHRALLELRERAAEDLRKTRMEDLSR